MMRTLKHLPQPDDDNSKICEWARKWKIRLNEGKTSVTQWKQQ